MRILSILLICILVVRSKIVIEDANIAALSHDDIGMIFYVAIKNSDNCAYTIITRMVKCVEEIEANDKDCDMMQLIGGDMGVIKPHCAKNITLVYPNMYLLNRKGYCIIAIKLISEDNQMLEKKTNISFNTYIKGNRRPLLVNGFFDKHKAVLCESVDQDPLNNCVPVDCHMKYVGTRSYFNKRWKRCQKVPKCVYDPDKELPDVGYTPITNKCMDLERCIRRTELTPLENKFAEMNDQNKYSMILTTIQCHHGKANNNTGLCDCDPGWGSAPFEPIPSLFTFHMCNIEKSSWYDSNRSMVTFIAFFISISSVCVAMLVVLVSFVLYHLYRCLRNMDKDKTESADVEEGQKAKDGVSGESSRSQDSPTRSKEAISDTNKTVYMATETSTRLKSGEHTDTLASEFSKGSKTSKETFKASKSSDSSESKASRTSSKSKTNSSALSSTDKSSKDSLKIRTSVSSSTRKK